MKLFKRQPTQNFSYGEGSFTGSHQAAAKDSLVEIEIVFFGSGPVAAKSLAMLAKNFKVEAVVTKPKPEHHKSNFPVIQTAEDLGLRIETVSSRQELSSLMASRPFSSRLGVLIDFGIILNQDVINYFPLGIINSHFSLLPLWRGADPITFTILSGDAKTGVSLMLIEEVLDTGKILVQKSLPISPDDTTPSLTDKLVDLSDELLTTYVPNYVHGKIKARAQPHADRATYSRKLTKQDGIIDWHKPAEELEREIRAFTGWPKSTTNIAGKEVIITGSHVVNKTGQPGSVSIDGKSLIVFAGKKALEIDRLKPSGKAEMAAAAFIAGYGQLLK